MADEQQTTGTPTQEGGDAAETQTAGTPAPEGRDAVSSAPDWKQLYLESKSTIEEANRVIRASREETPRTPTPAGDEENERRNYEAYVKQVADNAQDQNSLLWARQEQRRLQHERQMMDNQQLTLQTLGAVIQALPEEHQAPFRELAAHPEKYNSLADAQREIHLRKQQSEVNRLQQEIKRLQNQNAVPTAGRETQSVPEAKKEYTRTEWERRQAALTRPQAYAEQAELRRGEVKVNWRG